jgi:hypothetical protein
MALYFVSFNRIGKMIFICSFPGNKRGEITNSGRGYPAVGYEPMSIHTPTTSQSDRTRLVSLRVLVWPLHV